jgi:MoxR-like ATPase
MALVAGRNAFVHGMPGTGKDAVVHAFSAMTRKPCVMVTFRPGTDISPWFYSRSYSNDGGTGWKYGALWEALTQGVMGRDGKRRAALVLLSDVDRADSAQAEWFRILTDSISGRILGPDGRMVPILAGTQFICTANSCGTGDSRGRMTSANPIDASIMDRLGRAIEFTYLHWDDESAVLREKFPMLAQEHPEIFTQLQGCCDVLRKAIRDEEIFAEFTHRGICDVLAEAEDRVRFGKKDKLLSNAFEAWLDRLDADNRLAAKRLIDPHISGGSI